jgi:exopolysaccharide production protein ExoZ
MLFYAVFWLGLVLERPLLTCGLVILGLALSALFVVPSDPVWRSWSDPLMLEFVAGLVLSRMTWLRGGWIGAMLMLLATVGYGIVIGLLADFGHWRVLALGLPALLLVSGAVALDRAGCWPSIRPLELIGDCSYSLYLLHGIAIKLVEKFVRPDSVTAVLLGLIASLLAAYLSYRYFELPVAHALRRLLPARRRRAAG